MTKLSGKKSKKMIYFKMYRSILLQILCWFQCKKTFFISTIIFKSNGNGNGNDNSNDNSNGNGNVYLYFAFYSQEGWGNGVGTV